MFFFFFLSVGSWTQNLKKKIYTHESLFDSALSSILTITSRCCNVTMMSPVGLDCTLDRTLSTLIGHKHILSLGTQHYWDSASLHCRTQFFSSPWMLPLHNLFNNIIIFIINIIWICLFIDQSCSTKVTMFSLHRSGLGCCYTLNYYWTFWPLDT